MMNDSLFHCKWVMMFLIVHSKNGNGRATSSFLLKLKFTEQKLYSKNALLKLEYLTNHPKCNGYKTESNIQNAQILHNK